MYFHVNENKNKYTNRCKEKYTLFGLKYKFLAFLIIEYALPKIIELKKFQKFPT